jgi:2-(1,2-epoxy-1,2-dihydrophenyl)acetyl-CoA isomerase
VFTVSDRGAVRTLTISNPGRRNAIPTGEWARLGELLHEFEAAAARVLVITGAGEDFCSGADVGSDFVPGSVAAGYEMVDHVGAAAVTLHRTTKPTIAAVDGVAAGAGLNLALACDLLVASDRARFSEIFVKRGLTMDFGGTWLLPRRIGMARAKDLALTGRVIDAAEAERIGLVSRVVAAADLSRFVETFAEDLATGAPLAQRFVKAGLNRSADMDFEDAIAYERTAQALLLTSEDFIEGVTSFVQKRPPEFTGR